MCSKFGTMCENLKAKKLNRVQFSNCYQSPHTVKIKCWEKQKKLPNALCKKHSLQTELRLEKVCMFPNKGFYFKLLPWLNIKWHTNVLKLILAFSNYRLYNSILKRVQFFLLNGRWNAIRWPVNKMLDSFSKMWTVLWQVEPPQRVSLYFCSLIPE